MDSGIKPRRTHLTPFMSDLQIKLVGQIDDGATYTDIFLTVEKMTEELRQQTTVRVQDTLNAVQGDLDHKEMTALLHSILRPVLRSIVMRMVKVDFWDRDSDNRKLLYEYEGPGAYICGLSVIGRHGRTWSRNENIKLRELLRSYAVAIDACERRDKEHAYENSQFTPEELAALDVTASIDRQYGKDKDDDWDDTQTHTMPRFASSSQANKSKHVRCFKATLKERNVTDEYPDEPSLQSMYMVGNSDDVERPNKTTHIWGLLASCLKYMGLEAEETIIPVCKAWKVEHISFAEILVTVLAGSLVSVGGLNVAQPGTKSEKNPLSERILNKCRSHVWRTKPWLEENLQHTYDAKPDARRLAAAQCQLDKVPLEKLQEMANEELRDKVAAAERKLSNLITRRLARIEEGEALVKALEDREKGKAGEISRILQKFCRRSDDDKTDRT
ncbi:hypothetical protein F5B20DRAFT_593947 [Whalleya microplaca]|nr:hypothetical protein F5B20DRAFT_593947 [Whalleya microplaca]